MDPQSPSKRWAKPEPPRRAGVPPSQPGGRGPAWAGPARVPRPARPRRRLLALASVVACVLILAGSMHVFKLTTVVAEKLLIVALFSRVPPVQRVAIRALRNYPTKHAAVSLVVFINLKNLQEVPDPNKPETPEDKARRRQQRVRDLELAERATETLCLLTGQSFETYFKREPYGYSWGSLSEDKWPTVLWNIDTWALDSFGPGEPAGGGTR